MTDISATPSVLDPADTSLQVESLFSFSSELVGATLKSAVAGHAMTRNEASFMCFVEDIKVLENFNPRSNTPELQAHIRSIADSIKEEGYYQHEPISVYSTVVGKKTVFYVTNGHCRLKALELAISEGSPISEVPIMIERKATTMEDLTVAFVRANEGKKLDPLGLAICCKRLVGYNWTVKKVAQKLGITTEYVSQLLTLAGAPNTIRVMVGDGRVTATVALNAIRAHGADASRVLGEALQMAQGSGKARLTNKFLPEQVRRVALRKAAPKMFEAIQKIYAHASYKKLAPDLRDLIGELVLSMQAATADQKPQTTALELTLNALLTDPANALLVNPANA